MSGFSFFDKLNKISLYIVFFLFPIFFLPFLQNVLDFPKQFLALILVSLSLIGWFGKKMLERKVILRGPKILYLTLLFLFLSLFLSFIFSLWPWISFWGYPSADFADNFITYLLFLVLVFLIINSFEQKIELIFCFSFLFLSAAIIALFNLFQIHKIFLLPFDFAKVPSFNPIGSPNTLAIFFAALLPLAAVFIFKTKNILKTFFVFVCLLLFLNVLLINTKIVWLGLIVSILIFFIFIFENQKEGFKISWALILMLGLIISIFFYFFPLRLSGFPILPSEVSLTLNSEAYILKGAFGDGLKNILLGTGPGTFIFDYSKYHSPLLNQTIFWGTRFSQGHSFFFDWFLTKGFLAVFALLSFYFLIIYFAFSRLKKEQIKEDFNIKLGLSAALLSLIFISFLYPFNFSLLFLFFSLAGGFFFFFFQEKTTESPLSFRGGIVLNTIFVLILVGAVSLVFLSAKKILAEANYFAGIKTFQEGKIDPAISHFEKAIDFDSKSDVYWRDLSQVYLAKVNAISQNKTLPLKDRQRLANSAIAKGGEAINQATKIAPFNVANWNVRGLFYRSLIGVKGAGDLALLSYQKASELEPSSPFPYTEKARVHILLAQDFKAKGEDKLSEEHLNQALKDLKKSLKLKNDYAPASYLLAVVYDQKGDLDQAISKLEESQKQAPKDVGLAFQLGQLYWRKGLIEKAELEFKRALGLFPDYSNARYMLGLIYDKKGEKEKAIAEFKKVVELNPQNQEVKKILNNLENGRPALEGILSEQSGFQENPSEIK